MRGEERGVRLVGSKSCIFLFGRDGVGDWGWKVIAANNVGVGMISPKQMQEERDCSSRGVS